MARKRKLRQRQAVSSRPREEGAFNPVLKTPLPRKAPPPPPAPYTPAPETDSPERRELREEQRLFMEAMEGVVPLRGKGRRLSFLPDPARRPHHGPNGEDQEVVLHLRELVTGLAPLDITFSDEYVEGSVRGFDPKLMLRLKQGRFPLEDHLDLHGLVQQEAERRVQQFLLESHRLGRRCVLLIHGRGRNSEDHIPVLKQRLPQWLSRGPVRKIVLAFCTARPYDGGTGALYVFLRRRRPSGIRGRSL